MAIAAVSCVPQFQNQTQDLWFFCNFSLDFEQTFKDWTMVSYLPIKNWGKMSNFWTALKNWTILHPDTYTPFKNRTCLGLILQTKNLRSNFLVQLAGQISENNIQECLVGSQTPKTKNLVRYPKNFLTFFGRIKPWFFLGRGPRAKQQLPTK